MAINAQVLIRDKVIRHIYPDQCSNPTTKCYDECIANGYIDGVCIIGDVTDRCMCNRCEQTKCVASCKRDHLIGKCDVSNTETEGICKCY